MSTNKDTQALSRRRFAAGLAAIGGAAAWPARAQQGDAIRIVVGFAPGGTTDVLARVLAHGLTEALGRTVIVDNRPGASGNLAAGEVAKAVADGRTLLVAPTSVATANPSLFKANFDPAKDLAPVSSIGRTQMYVLGRPGLEAKDIKELVALAKARPAGLSYASAGAGTPPHLAAELFKQQAGIFATHIPYRGAAPALQDVMASQADYVFDPGIGIPHVKAGKVKLLGVASRERSPFLPDAPTLAEQGVRGAELDIWFGLWAPRGTSPELVGQLQRAAATVLARDSLRTRFAELAAEPAALDSAAFGKLLADERQLLAALIRDRKIAVD